MATQSDTNPGYTFPFDTTEGENNYTELALFAGQLAVKTATAIQKARAELGDLREYSQTKSSAVDPVTVVDNMAEELISEAISQQRPHDGFIGEEGSYAASVSGVTWVVDPIDGTVNFIYGHPNYAVSIAAAIDGEVVAGAVINVATGDLYLAARGCGAFKSRKDGSTIKLTCNQETDIRKALVATGFSYSARRRESQAQLVQTVLGTCRDIRRMGSAALDLCALADGGVDCYYEHALNAWDFAAGMLIAKESGGVVVAPALSVSGDEGRLIWATTKSLEKAFEQLISPFPEALAG